MKRLALKFANSHTPILLIAMIALLALIGSATVAGALPQVPSSSFASAETCYCHGTFQAQWGASMHAQAITDPIYTLKRDAAEDASKGLGEFCDTCHAPVAIMSGENPSDPSKLPAQSAEGVTCDFCHQVTGVTDPLENTALEVTADGTRRAQLKDAQAPHPTAYSKIHTEAAFCGACHNVTHPTNGLPLESTYTEWSKGPYAAEGTQCQDCHMTPGVGPSDNPGVAASGGPTRDHIYNMTFAGGNVALGDAELAEERLQGAATLDLKVDEIVANGAESDLSVTVTNSGAGHYLPTGLTEVRQMWLEVTATKADGTETQLLRRDFGTVLEDANGKAPVELWDAAKVKSDDRIPPKESVTEKAAFTQEDSTVTSVKAALYYRSASEEIAKESGVDIPTTTMAEKTIAVYTSPEAQAAAQTEAAQETASTTPWWIYAVIAVVVIAVIAGVAYYIVKKRKSDNV